MNVADKQENLFYQRLCELCDRCRERYLPEFTHFLDGRELSMAKQFLSSQQEVRVVCFGGFWDAERCVVGVFPEVIYSGNSEEELYNLFDVCGVLIKGSGFSQFSHRDVLGSVLSLGIKRETMGDIYVDAENKCAYVCMDKVAADFVCGETLFVARDKVKCSLVNSTALPVPERKFSTISGTVASERLDCIICLATNLSREKAKTLINSGLVNVNHFPETRCDTALCDGDLLSVRGYGRFKIGELGDLTRKGRIRAVIHKMI